MNSGLKDILDKFKTDTYLTSAMALELGLIDTICDVGSALLPPPSKLKSKKSKQKAEKAAGAGADGVEAVGSASTPASAGKESVGVDGAVEKANGASK